MREIIKNKIKRGLGWSISIGGISLFYLCQCCFYTQAQSNYAYDGEGRLIADLSEGIVAISWNKMSRVTQIIRADTSHAADLEFAYDSKGNRVMKLVKPRSGNGLLPQSAWNFTYYTYDGENKLIAVYTRSYEQPEPGSQTFTETCTLAEQVIRSTQGGRLKPDKELTSHRFNATIGSNQEFVNIEDLDNFTPTVINDLYSATRGNKNYSLGNHIDNALTLVTDRPVRSLSGQFQSEVLLASDYYPFGMNIPDRSMGLSNYRYGFSGKEKDDEIKGAGNNYDFGARFYDARIGRWLSEDPLARKYASLSPYNFVANNPLMLVDPDGRRIVFAKNTSPEFRKKYYQAVQYLVKHHAAKYVIALERLDKVFVIEESQGKTGTGIDKAGNPVIQWNPNIGIFTTNGSKISPTTVLVHELGHRVAFEKNPSRAELDARKYVTNDFESESERKAIQGAETETARKLGEICKTCVTREDHLGTPYKTINVTSTVPVDKTPMERPKSIQELTEDMAKRWDAQQEAEKRKADRAISDAAQSEVEQKRIEHMEKH